MRSTHRLVEFLVLILVLNARDLTCHDQKFWTKVEELVEGSVKSSVDYFVQNVNLSSSNVSSKCMSTINDYLQRLKNFESDAVKMFDSSGRIQSGLLSGQWISPGQYDDCVAVKQSQYCWLSVNSANRQKYSMNLKFRSKTFKDLSHYIERYRFNISFGVCLPSACSEQELDLLANDVVRSLDFPRLQVTIDRCLGMEPQESVELITVVAWTILEAMLALNVIGLFFPSKRIVRHFSPVKNWENLFTAKFRANECRAINGFKFLLMILTICGHVILFGLWHTSYGFRFFDIFDSFWGLLFAALVPYTPDMFLMISGLVIARSFLQDRKVDKVKFFLRRWLRFGVMTGFAICLYLAVFNEQMRLFYGGAFYSLKFYSGSGRTHSCRKSGISHLFLVAHFLYPHNNHELCLIEDYSLSLDLVYGLVFFFFIQPLLSINNRLCVVICVVLIAAANIYNFFLMVNGRIDWFGDIFDGSVEKILEYFNVVHSKPWIHSTSYFSGIILAIFYNSRNKIIKKKYSVLIWTIWFGGILLIPHLNQSWKKISFVRDWEHKSRVIVISNTFIVVTFFGWCLYSFLTNNVVSVIVSLMSSPFCKIASKLNLSLLFANTFVIFFMNSSARTVQYPSIASILLMGFVQTLIYTFIFAILIHVLLEAPLAGLIDSFIDWLLRDRHSVKHNHQKVS